MNEGDKGRWKIIKPVVSTDEIVNSLKKKIEEEPQNINYLKQLATLLYKQKRYEESFTYLEKLITSGVRDSDILSQYGNILLERGNHREAKTYFKEALDKNPNDAISQEGMLEIAKIEERIGKARRKIIKYAAITSSVVIVLMIISIVFTKNPFSFILPNKLYQGIVAYYVGKTSGTLKIETEPASVNISIDGQNKSFTTPAEVILKKGEHTISISKDDYKDYSTAVDIEAGKTKTVSISLQKQYLLVSTGSSLYQVSVDLKEKNHIGSPVKDIITPIEVSPDGKKILFYLGPPNSEDCSLWIMNPDGSQKKSLSEGMNGVPYSPSFSPDGKKIVFVCNNQIWIMNPDGSQKKSLTGEMVGFAYYPCFSPDGKKIVFVSLSTETKIASLWIMNPDGSQKENLTEEISVGAYLPSFSPDGKKILFYLRYNSGIVFPWIMNTDGTAKIKLGEALKMDIIDAIWYP